ncbi:MAG: ABC transporter substrate-binding protein [Phycisphaerae bacterium]|jgi:putative ABC transport system substrate-binding protein
MRPINKYFIGICILILALSGCGKKTQEPKTYRVGIISGVDVFIGIADGFRNEMSRLGYVEGRNIVYDLHKTNADQAAVELAVKKFVADKVDLIFAFPTEPALAARAAVKGTNIPVLFASAGIEENNLVGNIFKPGGNTTGCRYPGPELTVKRLEILCELAPQAKRVLIMYDPNYPMIPHSLKELYSVVSSLGVTLVEVPVNSTEKVDSSLQALAASGNIGIDAILIMPEILTQSPVCWQMIAKFASEHKIPVGGSAGFEADTGAVFSYIPDNFETGKLAAPLADKIFKGTQAGTIMVVTPPSQLRINYKKAQELGLKIPEGLLNRADEIIR